MEKTIHEGKASRAYHHSGIDFRPHRARSKTLRKTSRIPAMQVNEPHCGPPPLMTIRFACRTALYSLASQLEVLSLTVTQNCVDCRDLVPTHWNWTSMISRVHPAVPRSKRRDRDEIHRAGNGKILPERGVAMRRG